MAAYLRGRVNEVAIGVYDVTSHMTYLYRPLVHERTASMAKIDILADLLYEHQLTRRPLTSHQKYLATVMIELSNNSAATQLWNAIGGRDAINTFNTMIGYRQTIAGYGWGNIETTPRDELQLLKVIALPNRYLTTSSRNFEMQLMERVTPGERFGLGVGSPSGATVGLKDGYYNESDTGWQLNSAGYVEYQGRFYLACIMTTYNSDESYGITTLNDVAGLLWRDLRP